MLTDINNQKEVLKIIKKLFMDKKVDKAKLGIRSYWFYNGLLFSKVNDCNMLYNPEIEGSKCNNSYFKSIIDEVTSIENPNCIYCIDLKDYILSSKQYGGMNVRIKNDSILLTSNENEEFLIYPVKKKRNYHLFHGTTIQNAKKIIKDGYIKAKKIFKEDTAYNKVFLTNNTKYASIYSMIGGSSEWDKVFNEDSKNLNEYSIIFQVDTSKYYVYHYGVDEFCNEEYFIWDHISVQDIEKIYLMRYCEIVKEIELSTLDDLGDVIERSESL